MGDANLTAGELGDLVTRARQGDQAAWATLVRGTSRAVYKGLAAFDVPPEVRDELYHLTFIRLVERIHSIESPASLPAWLMTTARREALQYLRSRARLIPVDEVPLPADRGSLDEALLDSELKVAVARAFRRLSASCQALLRLLSAVPKLSYAEIAALLECPIGDIGPRRMRCLRTLRLAPEMVPFVDHRDAGGGT